MITMKEGPWEAENSTAEENMDTPALLCIDGRYLYIFWLSILNTDTKL